MASIIKSVSLSEDEVFFLEDYKLSPTQLLREKIWEMKGMLNKIAQNKIDKMAGVIQHQVGIIEKLNDELIQLGKKEE